MDEVLLTLVLGLVVLAAVYGAARCVARMERRTHGRNLSSRVYYPRRGSKADARVPVPGRGSPPDVDGAPPKD